MMTIFRRSLLSGLLISLIMAFASLFQMQAAQPSSLAADKPNFAPAGFHLVFEDDFETLSIRDSASNKAHTGIEQGIWTAAAEQGFGYEWFVDQRSAGFSPFSVSGSVLKIEAGPMPAEIAPKFPTETRGMPTCFGGLLSTRDSFARSPPFYVEARMKLSSHPAAWPAFWTLGRNREPWPSPSQYAKQWENDVMETFGKSTSYFTSTHWNEELGSESHAADYKGITTEVDVGGKDLSSSFNVYGSLMTATEVIWYFNGREVHRQPYPRHSDAQQAQYIVLDLAFGIPWAPKAIYPKSHASIEIDYVRAYAP
jgi:Glycosyl hydrolases family 16